MIKEIALTRQQMVLRLIEKFGHEGYCKKAFLRYNFPFIWSIDSNGEIQFDMNGLGDYLKRELSKGLNGDEIIMRDKKIQEDAVSLFYNETFLN